MNSLLKCAIVFLSKGGNLAKVYLGAEVTPREGLHQDYGRLAEFLRGLSLRLQLLALSEFLLLLISCILLVFLSSFVVLELRSVFPRLPLFYSFAAIITLALFLFLGLRRVVSRPTLEHVARGLEERFPDLRDDVTNSLLLFQQLKKGQGDDPVSESLIQAQIRKTATRVLSIQTGQVVRFKKILNHLKLLLPLVLAFSIVLVSDPHFLNRSIAFILHPFSAIPPGETAITLEPPDTTILRHTPVVLRAKTSGNIPDKLLVRIWPENREELRLTHAIRRKRPFCLPHGLCTGFIPFPGDDRPRGLPDKPGFVWWIPLRSAESS